MKSLAFALLLAGCSFHAPSDTIAPGDDDTGSDAGTDTGSDVTPDAPPDAPRVVVLSETSNTPHTGDSIFCHSGQMTRDNFWFRAFAMSDFPGITAPLHITSVSFGSELAKAAMPSVSLFSYTGEIGTPTLDPAKMAILSTHSEAVPDSTTPQMITFPLEADIPLGAVFVVQISATDQVNGQGTPINQFHIAFSDDDQTRPNYFASNTCGIGVPVAQAGASLIVDVAGTY